MATSLSPSIKLLIVFSAFVGTGGLLTPRRVFTVLSLVTFLWSSSVHLLMRCIFYLSEATVAESRIKVRRIYSGTTSLLVSS